MSIWGLIASASLVVQLVMLLLVLASVFSWVVIFQRVRVLRGAAKVRRTFEDLFWSGMDLSQLYRQVTAEGRRVEGIENIFTSGIKEFTRLRQSANMDPDAVMEGVQRAMRVALAREEEKLDKHLPQGGWVEQPLTAINYLRQLVGLTAERKSSVSVKEGRNERRKRVAQIKRSVRKHRIRSQSQSNTTK